MKAKYLIPILFLLSSAIVATAIAGPGGRGFFKDLDLSEDQQAQLKALHETRREQMKAQRDSGERPSHEDRQALREEFRSQLAQILTPEQLASLEEHRANRPERGQRGKRGGKGHLGRGFGGAGLDLSEDQQAQLKALHETRREQMKAQRNSGERPSSEERQALHEEFRSQLAQILTSEQLATLEEHRANRPERGHRGKRGGKGHFGRGLGGFGGADLDLSDAQKDQVNALRQTQREKMQALRESGERPSRETMQALRQEFRASFEALLTPEQLATLEAHKAARQAGQPASSEKPATTLEEKTWGTVKKDTRN